MTSTYLQIESRVLEAARAYSEGESSSLHRAAAAFEAPYARVRNRIAGVQSKSGRPGVGRLLTPAEEDDLLISLRRA